MGRIFNATLLQQTQNTDNSGGPTLTSIYTSWYDFNLPSYRIHPINTCEHSITLLFISSEYEIFLISS